jgi:hypothetical protein
LIATDFVVSMEMLYQRTMALVIHYFLLNIQKKNANVGSHILSFVCARRGLVVVIGVIRLLDSRTKCNTAEFLESFCRCPVVEYFSGPIVECLDDGLQVRVVEVS